MSADQKPSRDWDPISSEVLNDQRAAYDAMRRKCPVAQSDFLGWSLFQHREVTRVLHDPETFSNAVSRHLSVPNGMDPPEHTEYRRVIDQFFTPERMTVFEPACRDLASDLISQLPADGNVEVMADLARPFAVRVQCAFLGWPSSWHEPLVRWTQKNHEATLARDRQAMSEIAREFESYIDELLDTRTASEVPIENDVISALTQEKVWGRSLSNEEIASILRNWTVGEIGTIAASIGILAEFLSQHPDWQTQWRAQPDQLPAAIEEILRLHGPLVTSRRVATCPVEIGGRKIAAQERIALNWVSANRDEEVFDDPDTFRPERAPEANLLYGAGIHVCPGAPLARLEMRVFLEELLCGCSEIAPDADRQPTLAAYPASGFASLPLWIERDLPAR